MGGAGGRVGVEPAARGVRGADGQGGGSGECPRVAKERLFNGSPGWFTLLFLKRVNTDRWLMGKHQANCEGCIHAQKGFQMRQPQPKISFCAFPCSFRISLRFVCNIFLRGMQRWEALCPTNTNTMCEQHHRKFFL